MKVIIAACLASLIALPALARDPQPKPSNVTIHLFGPNFITSSNSPSSPSSTSSSASASTSSPGSTPEAQPEPTLHEVLHEMFVTGDPQDKGPHFPHPDKVAR